VSFYGFFWIDEYSLMLLEDALSELNLKGKMLSGHKALDFEMSDSDLLSFPSSGED